MSADDLLSFKEYSPVRTQGGGAEINVNSPSHQTRAPYGATNTNIDPLQDLMNSMDTSVNVIHNEDRQRSPQSPQSSSFAVPGVDDDKLPQSYSIFSIEYYQKFFNVDTEIVKERFLSAIVPRRAPVNYLKHNIGMNPDLYGPFWICTTLIFSIAISGNMAKYFQEAAADHYRYNFHLVSLAATTIVMYVCMMPLLLWTVLKWTQRPVESDLIQEEDGIYTPSLLTLICLYGYSLGVYIPVSVFLVIPISLLQWVLVIVAALSTGTVLIIVLSPALHNSSKSPMLVGGILVAHFLLAAGFLLYFFHYHSSSPATPNGSVALAPAAVAPAAVIPAAVINQTTH